MAEITTTGSRVGLRIDFKNDKDLLDWFEKAQEAGLLKDDLEVYKADGLDMNSTSVPKGRTRVLREKNSRSYGKVK